MFIPRDLSPVENAEEMRSWGGHPECPRLSLQILSETGNWKWDLSSGHASGAPVLPSASYQLCFVLSITTFILVAGLAAYKALCMHSRSTFPTTPPHCQEEEVRAQKV